MFGLVTGFIWFLITTRDFALESIITRSSVHSHAFSSRCLVAASTLAVLYFRVDSALALLAPILVSKRANICSAICSVSIVRRYNDAM
jgi:hypothetical protein